MFEQLGVPDEALQNLAQLGYKRPTPIQVQCIPLFIQGKDIIAQAKTGSGKTAAFGIGLIAKLKLDSYEPQCLVLCPTRELASQVTAELRKLARYRSNVKIVTLCGGQPIGPQIGSLEMGAHIVVGTPGRIVDHLRKKTLSLLRTHTLILDEADRMLDMGFEEDMQRVLDVLPLSRQTLFFSATYPKKIASLSERYQCDPVSVLADVTHEYNKIEQTVYFCEADNKAQAVIDVLGHYQPESAILFLNTKVACDEYARHLNENQMPCLVLHGGMEQRDRDQVLIKFSHGSCRYLLATDVAARGLDIANVNLVVNVDLPKDPAVYIHRIGRTGRADSFGQAVSLLTLQETFRRQLIEEQIGHQLAELKELPQFSKDNAPERASMVTLCLAAGRKEKIRAGDVLGALVQGAGLDVNSVGKITIVDHASYVSILRVSAQKVLDYLNQHKIKGRFIKVRRI